MNMAGVVVILELSHAHDQMCETMNTHYHGIQYIILWNKETPQKLKHVLMKVLSTTEVLKRYIVPETIVNLEVYIKWRP